MLNLKSWKSQSQPVEWDHGFISDHVKATRYTSPHMGFNVGFTLFNHPYDCDRASMADWLKSHDVHVFQMGGYPGADIFAKVSGVNTKEGANEWLPDFLPKFDNWINCNLGPRNRWSVKKTPEVNRPAIAKRQFDEKGRMIVAPTWTGR